MFSIREGFRLVIGKACDFTIKNKKYFLALGSFVLIALVLFNGTTEQAPVNDPYAGIYKPYSDNNNENLNNLINNFYSCYVAGDVESLKQYATPVSDEEASFISFYSQYIEAVTVEHVYYKKGLNEGDYAVSVKMDMKYNDASIPAAGVDFFYVQTTADGTMYINNVYGSFNQSNAIYDLDPEISKLIAAFEKQQDVLELNALVQAEFKEDVEADENLALLVNDTFTNAFAQWRVDYEVAVATAQEEARVAEEAAAAEAVRLAEEQARAEQEAYEEANAFYGKINSKANVRKSADANSDKLGSLDKGTDVKVYAKEDDFYKIDFNGEKAYVLAKLITVTENAATGDTAQETAAQTQTAPSVAEGTVVKLDATCNIRKGMSTDSEKVAKVSKGESVTVIMSYAEGWTKVKYGNKEGYIRTDLLL